MLPIKILYTIDSKTYSNFKDIKMWLNKYMYVYVHTCAYA